MSNEIDVTQNTLDRELNWALENAASIITKSYLDNLEAYNLVKPSEEDLDINLEECSKFFKLDRLVLNKEENFLNKLTTIVNVAFSIDNSLATVIKSDGQSIEYYFGIISKNNRLHNKGSIKRREADVRAFKGALSGNLQGSNIEEIADNEIVEFQKSIFDKKENCYSSVSGIVALRDEEDKKIEGYVQGIENLVDSLKGLKYTIIMLADSVSSSEIQTIKQGYELLYTQLASFQRSSVTINENDTISLSKAQTKGVTEGISKGISLTQSTTDSKGKSNGFNLGISTGVDLGFKAEVSAGYSHNKFSSTARSSGRTDTTTDSSSYSRSVTDTTSSSKALGKSLQLNYENRSVKSLLDRIDKHLERLDECESFGAFNCAAYVVAENREDALTVASNYNALMRGKESCVQASHINTWHMTDETKIIGRYLESFVHPRFTPNNAFSAGNNIIVTPASIVSGNELAIQIGLPKKSINGVTVVPMAPFGRNILKINEDSGLYLGNLYHMGHNEGVQGHENKVCIDVESLSMHTFITGSTGSGKSSAVYAILDRLMEHTVKDNPSEKVKFMVIEPAKGEYKDRFGNYENVHVYGTNIKKMPLLKINPFSFPDEIHVLEHTDRLIEIFNVCWPMYAAMPAVLKNAVERAYICAGWDLDTSECKYKDTHGKSLYPSFVDVLQQINVVMDESQYSSDNKGDYKGALCTRIESLTSGLYKQIFTYDEIEPECLFDENVIIDLSRVGSSETKSLIMGLLVMKLQEYRMSGFGSNLSLRHVTVLEEAHNLLKRTSTEQSAEGANLIGKSVEMLANSIAEMRTYGEGFIIVDQAPGLMDMSTIRNTNTKVILRLPDLSDRELVGRAAGLNDEQIGELSRLKTFVAAVYQNNWLEPVLCNIDVCFKEQIPYSYYFEPQIIESAMVKQVVEYMLMPLKKRNKLGSWYIDKLKKEIWNFSIPAEAKIAFLNNITAKTKKELQTSRAKTLYHIFNAENAFSLSKINEDSIDIWYKNMCEVLQPDMKMFSELEQKKIIAILLKEKANMDDKENSRVLFESVMNYIK